MIFAHRSSSNRYTTAGKFSAPFHFIDAEDNPPSSCSVDYNRDCGPSGCSVSAIANYTTRVQATTKLSKTEIATALKFLVHFLGDITQPLHDEAYEVGGNDVAVTFNGTSTNLHHSWDTNIPEGYRGGYQLADAASWANDIVKEIDSGAYASAKSGWLAGMNVSDPVGSAMLWAQDANKYVCSTVMPHGASALESGDLYPTYYNGVVSTIELQIAKGGYRYVSGVFVPSWMLELMGGFQQSRQMARRHRRHTNRQQARFPGCCWPRSRPVRAGLPACRHGRDDARTEDPRRVGV